MVMVAMLLMWTRVKERWSYRCNAADVDDTPPFTFPRHVHSREEMMSSSGVVSSTLMSRPAAYHSSSARSLTALQHSTGKGGLLFILHILDI